jgi:NAD(P)-dependent dehydrogenase (short-subunit alcohol dehydrogenase family)
MRVFLLLIPGDVLIGKGVFLCQREQIKRMVGQQAPGARLPRGTIINIASTLGLQSTPSNIPSPAYVASKHGVLGLTKADGAFYGAPEYNVKINAICPGYIATPLLKEAAIKEGSTHIMAEEFQRTPMRRLGTMEEVGDVAVFLASEMSSFMCGTAVVVDGGHTIV